MKHLTKLLLLVFAILFPLASFAANDDANLVEIAQTQSPDCGDGAERATIVEGDGYTAYTTTGGISVIIKILDVDVAGCDSIYIKFAEPLPAGINASFAPKSSTANFGLTEGITEFKIALSDSNCDVNNNILSQITLLTLWNGGKTVKVSGVYKHKIDSASEEPSEEPQPEVKPEAKIGESDHNITIGTLARSYKLYVPKNYNAENATPLVFSLHGTGGHSSDKSPFRTSVADQKGCIVVYPQGKQIYFPVFGGYNPGWESTGVYTEDIDFFKAIIEEVAAIYNIDRERIYCCGFSNGGMMTYTVANVASDIFAAFASISGFPLNEFHLHHTGARPVPFLHIHGKADDFVKYSLMPNIVDNMVARNGAKPVPTKTSVAGKYDKSIYAKGDGGFSYTYYEIDGMGHNDYTSNTADGNSALTMWKHFEKYTLSSECDTTLKWRPRIEEAGYVPKSHGWTISGSSLMFGTTTGKTDANQNVYRSLQLAKGWHKLVFKSSGDNSKPVTVKIIGHTSKKTVLSDTINVGEDAAILFYVEKDWEEYRFMMGRANANTIITDIAIHSATPEEVTAITSLTDDKKSAKTSNGKFLSNGNVVIFRDGVKYNVTGRRNN